MTKQDKLGTLENITIHMNNEMLIVDLFHVDRQSPSLGSTKYESTPDQQNVNQSRIGTNVDHQSPDIQNVNLPWIDTKIVLAF